MIFVINRENFIRNNSILQSTFIMRHKVAVDHWGWRIPGAGSGLDCDQFDTPDTIHFVKLNDRQEVIGCARLNPSTKPHMLSEVFAEVCDRDGVPVGDDTFEFSRFFVDKSAVSRREYIAVGYELLAGIAEWCFDKQIKKLSWYAFQVTYGLALPLWKTSPLGAPHTHESDESVYVPAISTIDEDAVVRTKAKANIQDVAYAHIADIAAEFRRQAA